MEFLTILLSGLLAAIAPAGVVVEQVAENAIRNQLVEVEQLQIRVDNTPNYQLVQGRVDRLRLAGRGIYPRENLRIAALEVETDAIAVDPSRIREGRVALQRPLQAGVRLVLTDNDITEWLQSPGVIERFRNLSLQLFRTPQAQALQRYDIVQPRVTFLAGDRLRLQVELQEQGNPEPLAIELEAGLQVIGGHRLAFIEPQLLINGEAASPIFVEILTAGLSQRLDLRILEDFGVTARILQLEVQPTELQLATFVRIDPTPLTSGNSTREVVVINLP